MKLNWQYYQKIIPTKMLLVKNKATALKIIKQHPEIIIETKPKGFYVQTREGRLFTPYNSWLAIDSKGYPYPIAYDEHKQIYRKTKPPFTE